VGSVDCGIYELLRIRGIGRISLIVLISVLVIFWRRFLFSKDASHGERLTRMEMADTEIGVPSGYG